jgi:hypothetical protein
MQDPLLPTKITPKEIAVAGGQARGGRQDKRGRSRGHFAVSRIDVPPRRIARAAPHLADWKRPIFDQVTRQLPAIPPAPVGIDRELGDAALPVTRPTAIRQRDTSCPGRCLDEGPVKSGDTLTLLKQGVILQSR